MREAAFLKQNVDKWKKFEILLTSPDLMTPDQLSDVYVQITDDLSHCRTFYPQSKSTVYLNGLAIKVHQALYRNKREDYGRIARFWKHEVPQAIADSWGSLMLSFAVFTVALALGMIFSAQDDSVVRAVLGDDYVSMTLENIRKGTPMAVYSSSDEVNMFVRIAENNVRVSIYTYVFGAALGVGTLGILISNGLMVGTFQFLCIQQGVALPMLMTLWIHGVIEISCIILAGAAGLTLGAGILFPGTRTRKQSFLDSGRRSVKIMMGIVPLIVLAALIEGFVTRHSGYAMGGGDEVEPVVSGIIIAGSLVFVSVYFVYMPFRLRRQARRAHRAPATDAPSVIIPEVI